LYDLSFVILQGELQRIPGIEVLVADAPGLNPCPPCPLWPPSFLFPGLKPPFIQNSIVYLALSY